MPAYPDHGRDCWAVDGTLCRGEKQGSAEQKRQDCITLCKFMEGGVRRHDLTEARPRDRSVRVFQPDLLVPHLSSLCSAMGAIDPLGGERLWSP